MESPKRTKKALFIGGGVLLLLLSMIFGAIIAGPFLAAAASGSQTTTTTTSSTNPYCTQFQQDLAKRLGVSVSTLQQDRKAAIEDVLAQMVKDGKLTQSQANNIKARIESNQACTGKGGQFSGLASGKQTLMKYRTDVVNQVAQGLHLTSSQLMTQLQSGKSLSDIATAQHISSSQLQTIVINAIQNTLNKAVTAGDLTQQQASNILQQVQSHPQLLNKLLNAHLGKGPKGQNVPSQQSI